MLAELLSDTVDLAMEEGATDNADSFVDFVVACIPLELLNELLDITGGSSSGGGDAEDREDPSRSVTAFLAAMWDETFPPSNVIPAQQAADAPRSSRCCEVCERSVKLTRHHVYPRTTHKMCVKKGVAVEPELSRIMSVCRLCHDAIHRFFSNEQLALEYHTLEALLSDEKFYRFAHWNSKQSSGRQCKLRL